MKKNYKKSVKSFFKILNVAVGNKHARYGQFFL